MSEPTRPGQSDFIRTLLQLNAAQASAKVGTPEREDAAHELKTFLMFNGQGRLQEWFASRRKQGDVE